MIFKTKFGEINDELLRNRSKLLDVADIDFERAHDESKRMTINLSSQQSNSPLPNLQQI
jgi:hypothetical protein